MNLDLLWPVVHKQMAEVIDLCCQAPPKNLIQELCMYRILSNRRPGSSIFRPPSERGLLLERGLQIERGLLFYNHVPTYSSPFSLMSFSKKKFIYNQHINIPTKHHYHLIILGPVPNQLLPTV